MSGAVAAHAAYNGSGTQGLAVTNKIHDDDGDVMSVFWNKNDTTRQLLYGSSFVEVPSSGGSGNTTLKTENNTIFDINNDIDCLGDMVLNLKFKYVTTANPAVALKFTPQQLADFVTRIEVHVGTQIWQTFENADLLSLAATELSSGAFADFCFQTSGGVTENNLFSSAPALSTEVANNKEANCYVPIKLFTKTLSPNLENFAEQTENGYLMAAAPHQQVKVKVFTKADSSLEDSSLHLSLYAKNQVMCNEEREQIKAMPMGLPKRLKMTQNKTHPVGSATSLDINLDTFSLYASHIIISLQTDGTVLAEALNSVTAELLLNSSSYSGKLPLGLLKLTGASMGLFANDYWISDVNNSSRYSYVFPLASQAYGGSSVPLNRFDNIRLKLVGLPSDVTGNVNVTCIGETTALYKGGAASLAMY